MKYGLIGLLIVTICNLSLAQDWVTIRENGGDLYEVEAAFEAEWQGSEYVRGKGYKQFQRWKSFWEPRLYPTGSFDNVQVDFLKNDLRNNKHTNSVTKDAGNWHSLGLESLGGVNSVPRNGRINVIFKSAGGSGDLFVGTPAGGMWKSSDNGNSWSAMTDNIPSIGVSGIAVDYSNEDIIYIATGDNDNRDTYSVGVLKSTDGGNSWNTTSLSFTISEQVRCNVLLMHPTNPNILLCGTTGGLYRTENGGLSWEFVYNGDIEDVKFKVNDPSVVYIAKEKLYKSTDTGLSFTVLDEGLPNTGQVGRMRMALTAADPDVIYLCYVGNDYSFSGLYRSEDGGETWELRSDSPNLFVSSADGLGSGGQAWYDMEIAVSPVDENDIIVGGVNLWESNDGGLSWDLNAYWVGGFGGLNYVHADIHYLEYDGNTLYCGSDGGINVSNNFGSNFTDITEGLSIAQNYRLGVDINNSELLLTGAQDNGTNRLQDNDWDHVHGADGFDAIIDYENSTRMYCCTQNGGIQRSINGGNSFMNATVGITENGAWNTPYIMSPLNPNILYAGYENVWRSNDNAVSWEKISTFDDQLHSLAMCKIDPNVIYAASYNNIYKTTEGGGDWTNVTAGLSGGSISYIAVDPLNADRVWLSMSGFNENSKVYYSDDGAENWQNISQGLPNLPVNTIVYNSDTDDEIYVGTDQGVYFRNSDLASWESFNIDLPNTIVMELEIHYDSGQLFAATFGRGVWVSNLWNGPEIEPLADFNLSQNAVCIGNEIEFTDLSILNEPSWEWTFEGGSPLNSDEMNPVVQYNEIGDYDVTLTVQNEIGFDTYTCVDCIHVFSAPGVSLPLIEGFESISNVEEVNWFVVENDEEVKWEINETVGATGTQSIWLENYILDVQKIYEIYSQPFDLSADPGDDNYYLSFKYAYGQIDGEESDRFRVYVSQDCGENWSLKADWSGNDDLVPTAIGNSSFVPISSQWISLDVELDDEAMSEEVMIKFWFRNANGNNIYIDDINIFSGVVGVDEVSFNTGHVIMPNPAKDQIQIEILNGNSNWEFFIYDNLGRLVKTKNSNSNIEVINVSDLNTGIYLYTILFDNGGVDQGKLLIEK